MDLSGEESRARAVAVATELFALTGFKGTSVAAVAARTGLSQSGLLHHFPSKAALLTAVLEERDRQDGDFLAGGDGPPLGWAAFDALGALVARNSTRPHLVGLFVRLAAEATDPAHPAHAWVLQHYSGLTRWLTDAVRTGQERGEIAADAPVASLVRLTIAVVDGVQQQWLLHPDQVSMTAEFEEFTRTLRARWSR
ncbi:helix-turn-helix domain-containing protein [Lentzea sp. NPDC003310]|uniref:TetR/AcrR family transcriptional regulator n=1 Tax=Lentzea sp. NPDC003310 TaxID=3154447 RepID=UPI0033B80D2F